MTAPITHPSPPRRPRRRSVHLAVVVLVLVLLLAPVVYLFGKLWASTSEAISVTSTEQAAVAYARPLDKLHSALVDARYAAVRRASVDLAGLRAAVEAVNGVDRQYADVLQVRQRWIQLTHEIDSLLARNSSGPDALRAYAAPIALTQTLLDQVAQASQATRDPDLHAYRLVDVALHELPDVVAATGELASLAFPLAGAVAPASRSNQAPATRPDPRLAVAGNRLDRAADAVSVGLRAGTDPSTSYPVDLRLLELLDEFAAATGELSQLVAELDVAGSGAGDRVDASSTRVTAAALALESAVLDAFETSLGVSASGQGVLRRNLVLAGAVIVLAAVALLRLLVASIVAAVPEPAAGVPGEGRHAHRAETEDGGPEAERLPNIVDARELIARELRGRPPGTPQKVSGQR